MRKERRKEGTEEKNKGNKLGVTSPTVGKKKKLISEEEEEGKHV